MPRLARLTLALGLSGALAACAIKPAPEIATPEPELGPAFAYAPENAVQTSVRDLLPYADPAFASLAASALEGSPTLAEAVARIDLARGRAARAGAERLPNVGADAAITRNQINPAQFGQAGQQGFIPEVQTSYGANLTARWDPDVFGQLRAQERAALARLDAASAQAGAVRNALLAEIAGSVIDWRTLEARSLAIVSDLGAATRLAELSGVREAAGIAPGFDRVRAQAQASASRSRLAAIESEKVRIVGRLVTLTGQSAAKITAALAQSPVGNGAEIGVQIALGAAPAALPSELLTNRPDVIAAAAELAATDEDLAAASRARFPKFSLSAVVGLLAFDPEDFFDGDSFVSTLAAGVAGPLFDFGRIEAEIDSAAAGKRAAFAAYRGAVFQALGDAEAAYGLIAAADAEADLARQEQAQLDRAVRLADARFRAGLSSFLEVLEARRAADASGERAAAALGRAQRARVLLWQALGGETQPAAPEAETGLTP